MKTNTIIFGGSFDPIHLGHIDIIKEMFQTIDNIKNFYVVVAGEHPESKKYLFSDSQRLKMVRASLGFCEDYKADFYNPNITVSDIEIKKQGRSYTIDTLKSLYDEDSSMHLVMGADQAEHFSLWKNAKEISKLAELWYFPRDGYTADPDFKWHLLQTKIQNISSTYIRELLLKKDSILNQKIPFAVKGLAPLFLNML